MIAGRQGGEAELGMFPQRGLHSLVEEVFLEEISTTFFYAAIGAVLLFSLLGFLLSRGFSRPLEQLARGAHAVADGDLADVTIHGGGSGEIRELAESFRRMVRRLAERDSLQRRMTSDIAHELRTPVSILQSHLEGIAEGVMPATPEAIASLREETGRLNRIIDDLKAIWEIERTALVSEIRETPLAPLVETTVARFQSLAAERGIRLSLTIDPQAATSAARLDPRAFDQAIGNILANALRYADQGNGNTPPAITVAVHSGTSGPSVTIADSGPGIPTEDLERVFERFYRVDAARDRQSGGAGLGLAIAREALQAMGGTLTAANTAQGGACFTIRAPLLTTEGGALVGTYSS
jgi:two-component system sensor histidine kinase BaeS